MKEHIALVSGCVCDVDLLGVVVSRCFWLRCQDPDDVAMHRYLFQGFASYIIRAYSVHPRHVAQNCDAEFKFAVVV